MTLYSKVERRIWKDAKFRGLSRPEPNAQSLFQRLLTAPEMLTAPGLIPVRASALADELGWVAERLLERFAELSRKRMAYADWDAGLVFLPNAIKYNQPSNLNMIKGWASSVRELPECELLSFAISHISWHVTLPKGVNQRTVPEPFHKPLAKPSWNGIATQEQEQEQEQEIPPKPPQGEQSDLAPKSGQSESVDGQFELTEPETAKPKKPKRKRKDYTKDPEVLKFYGHWCTEIWSVAFPGESAPNLSGNAANSISKLIKKHGLAYMLEDLKAVRASSWHMVGDEDTKGPVVSLKALYGKGDDERMPIRVAKYRSRKSNVTPINRPRNSPPIQDSGTASKFWKR